MGHESSKPAIRRLLPRPAALSVTDDAGAARRYDVPLDWLPRITHERDAVSRAVRHEQMQAGWDQSMNWIMAAIAVAYATVARMTGLPGHFMFAGIFALCAGGAWITLWVAHRRIEANWDSLGRQWADAGLGRGRCPICLYSLAGAEAGEAGLARCAECGAAWQHDRIWPAPEREQPPWRRLLGQTLRGGLRRCIRDDVGRAFSAERLQSIATRMSSDDPYAAQAVRKVRSGSDPARIITAGAVAALLLLPVAALVSMGQGSPLPAAMWLMIAIAFVFPAILLVATIGRSELGLSARARRRRMLQAGLCPVCASRDMAPHELHPGHRRCAGCSATWRVEPLRENARQGSISQAPPLS